MQLHNLQVPPTASQTRHLLVSDVAGHGICRSQKALQYGAGCGGKQLKPNLSGKVSQAFELGSLYLQGKDTLSMSFVGPRTTSSKKYNKQVQSTLL